MTSLRGAREVEVCCWRFHQCLHVETTVREMILDVHMKARHYCRLPSFYFTIGLQVIVYLERVLKVYNFVEHF